jgi:carboxypeptidase C (cathepsin A)
LIDFKECNHAGHNLMKMDGMGVVREVVKLLDVHKIPMLFYNGQFDLICNHLGTETLLNSLEWTGKDDFINAAGKIMVHENELGWSYSPFLTQSIVSNRILMISQFSLIS